MKVLKNESPKEWLNNCNIITNLARFRFSAQNCVGQTGPAEFVDSFELAAKIEKHFDALKNV